MDYPNTEAFGNFDVDKHTLEDIIIKTNMIIQFIKRQVEGT